MDAVEYLKAMDRMCESHDTCCECGLAPGHSVVGWCGPYIFDHPELAVRIVEEWSKAHPAQTRREKFKEVFGITMWESIDEGHGDWDSWWDAPYEAPKGD